MTEKEIGMVKLMGYVEEMQKEGINICRPRFQEYYLLEMMLVSKHYGLIKWLVENEKIDYDIIKSEYAFPIICNDYMESEYSDLESLLMLLSIQDEPIEFLISILK